jgi:hypothetical protein
LIENRRENKVPKNLRGYQWIYNEEERDKEYEEETKVNAINWCKNMEFNLRKLDPVKKLKLLFDKWVITQNQEFEEMIKIHLEVIAIAYERKEFEIMNRIAKQSINRKAENASVFFSLAEIFSRNVVSRTDFEKFKNDWGDLNKENKLWNGAKFVNKEYMELFTHMCTVCRFVNR